MSISQAFTVFYKAPPKFVSHLSNTTRVVLIALDFQLSQLFETLGLELWSHPGSEAQVVETCENPNEKSENKLIGKNKDLSNARKPIDFFQTPREHQNLGFP